MPRSASHIVSASSAGMIQLFQIHSVQLLFLLDWSWSYWRHLYLARVAALLLELYAICVLGCVTIYVTATGVTATGVTHDATGVTSDLQGHHITLHWAIHSGTTAISLIIRLELRYVQWTPHGVAIEIMWSMRSRPSGAASIQLYT